MTETELLELAQVAIANGASSMAQLHPELRQALKSLMGRNGRPPSTPEGVRKRLVDFLKARGVETPALVATASLADSMAGVRVALSDPRTRDAVRGVVAELDAKAANP